MVVGLKERVVGLIKKCIRGAGYRRRRAQRGAAEPRGGRKGAGERSMAERRERGGRAAHTQHRRWDCG